jgi:hypothetical protein
VGQLHFACNIFWNFEINHDSRSFIRHHEASVSTAAG